MKITIPIAGLECRWWHALPALALLGAACAKREAPPSQQQPAAAAMAAPQGPAPTAPLHFPQGKTIADVLTDAALRADLVSQAAALNYDTSLGAADRRYLAPETPGGPAGPYGEIAPEFGAAATSHADAVRGRVFGRIYLARAYRPLMLPAGYTYIWCDSLQAADSAAASWRAFAIPAASGARVVQVRFRVQPYPFGTKAVARWFVLRPAGQGGPGDDGYCVPCNSGMCCPQGGS